MRWVMKANVTVDADNEYDAEVLCLAVCLQADESEQGSVELDRDARPFEEDQLVEDANGRRE